MKAVQILGDLSSPQIFVNRSMTKPVPKNAEILVQVHAAGVTSDEVLWPEVYRTASRIPGHDISGVIAAIGPEYNGSLKVGQHIFALLAADRGEGMAEYAICSADEVAPKPTTLSHKEAAALPIPFLTAWEAISDHLRIRPGMRVLVTGASGAVGFLFVQLASQLAGANIVALASSRNHGALKQLGADEVVDYNVPGWEKLVTNVDVVFDTVGGDVLAKTWEVVKHEGAIVTVGDPAPTWAFDRGQVPEIANHPGVKCSYFVVCPNGKRLNEASKMIDASSVKPLAVKPFQFPDAGQAWSYAQQRNRGHKVVIDFMGGGEEPST
ncbi:Fc.00g048760.m01.CDS01 [Cosmosporella sp. VM-42]